MKIKVWMKHPLHDVRCQCLQCTSPVEVEATEEQMRSIQSGGEAASIGIAVDADEVSESASALHKDG